MTTAAPKARIAVIKGVWAKPGVSLNRRLYTAEHIAAAATEAQGAIDSGTAPQVFSMLTHHGARHPNTADVTKTAGRLTKVGVDSRGYGTFEAELADTEAGRDVAALVTPEKPYLDGVSMASVWNSAPKTVTAADGNPAETADAGFGLRGIDFTHSPGIPEGARITSAEIAEGDLTETLLLESAPEHAQLFVEADPPAAPYGNVTYADPGYQKDKKKRYPIDTKAHIRAAWAYINKGTNASKYSDPQVARIKGKIKRAAKAQGINIGEDLTVFGREILEAYVSMSADNGPGSVSVSAYGVDGGDITTAARIVGMAALAALGQLDPDMDGDLDLDRFDTDEAMEECPNCGEEVSTDDQFCSACGTSLTEDAPGGNAADESTQEGTMPDPKENTGDGAVTEALSDDVKKLVAEAAAAQVAETLKAAGLNPDGTKIEVEESDELKAARKLIEEADKGKTEPEPAPATAPVTETAPAAFDPAALAATITESVTKAVTESVKADLIEEIRRNPQRKGHVAKSILEQAPDEVYGLDPGEKGENLRPEKGVSLRDLEKMTDDAFVPVLS